MATSLKFPSPTEVTDEDPVAWRSSEEIIAIANAANAWNYTNLSPKVQDWVRMHGKAIGWGAVYFPMQYPLKTKRVGAVFVK